MAVDNELREREQKGNNEARYESLGKFLRPLKHGVGSSEKRKRVMFGLLGMVGGGDGLDNTSFTVLY